MDDSKIRVVGKVLGVSQILLAIVYVDPKNLNQTIVAILLFLGGLLMLTADSKAFGRLKGVLAYLAILLSIALVVKVLFID